MAPAIGTRVTNGFGCQVTIATVTGCMVTTRSVANFTRIMPKTIARAITAEIITR